ncbi:MAG: DoxX family protein [Gammaproteobacteria bacterium]|nr:MAG: DoxX family protein [Gammaproteobacteria bacterium]
MYDEDEPRFTDDLGRLLLRLGLGAVILLHGIDKILHPAAIEFIARHVRAAGLPEFVTHGVYIGEIVAPLMLIFGVFSRLGGLLISINMGFAIYLVHRSQLLQLTEHGGWQLELQGMLLLCGLVIALLGGGRLALVRD